MRKLALILLVCLCLLVALVGCGEESCAHLDADGDALCDTCGNCIDEDGKTPHWHAFGAWSVTKAPTCTEKGTEARSCACGEVETRYVAVIAHVFDQKKAEDTYLATDATCEAAATYYYSCACGAKGTETFSEGDVTSHAYVLKKIHETYFVSDATCEAAMTYYYSCVCGEKGAETFTVGEALPHAYTERSTDAEYLASEATCKSAATYYRSCACGAKSTETFASGEALPHVYTEQSTDAKYLASEATCKAAAAYYYSCACGAVGTETFTEGDVAPHAYTEQNTDAEYLAAEASCGTAATYYYSCKCGLAGDETFAYGSFMPHSFNVKDTSREYLARAATCTSSALYYYSCACGAKSTSTFTHGLILTHDYTQQRAREEYLATPATCAAAATYYYSCTCGTKGWTTFSSGDVAPHAYTEQVAHADYLATEATCTSVATYYYSCACGLAGNKTFAYGEMASHSYTAQVASSKYFATRATCTAAATYYYSCTCGLAGDKTFAYGEALPHVYDCRVATERYLATKATCTAVATYYYSCDCGAAGNTTFRHGSVAPHVYDREVMTEQYLAGKESCTEPISYYYSCVCGLVGTESFTSGVASGHKLQDGTRDPAGQLIDAVAPGCTTPGSVAFYACFDANCPDATMRAAAAFVNADGTAKVGANDPYYKAPNGHDYTDEKAYAATCDKPSFKVAACSACGVEEWKETGSHDTAFEAAIPGSVGYNGNATGNHDYKKVENGKAATCAQTGKEPLYACNDCGALSTAAGQSGAVIGTKSYKAAQYTVAGVAVYTYCEHCVADGLLVWSETAGAYIDNTADSVNVPAGHAWALDHELEAPAGGAVKVGTDYYLAGVNANGALYAKNSITSGRLNAAADVADAAVWQVEARAVAGEYYIFTMIGGTKTYLGANSAATSSKTQQFRLFTEKSDDCIWIVNITEKSIVSKNFTGRCIGTQNTSTNNNFSTYATSNYSGANAADYAYVWLVAVEGFVPPAPDGGEGGEGGEVTPPAGGEGGEVTPPASGALATFEFGENGEAKHYDGKELKADASYTVNGYTLTPTNVSKVYGNARDAKGNSCLKFGTSDVVGTMTFTVANDVNKIVIRVAAYKDKAKENTAVINGVVYTLDTISNSGEYVEIEIDTTTVKTITLASHTGTTGSHRLMLDSISYYA